MSSASTTVQLRFQFLMIFETDICGELLRFFLWAEADIQNFTIEFFHAGGDN